MVIGGPAGGAFEDALGKVACGFLPPGGGPAGVEGPDRGGGPDCVAGKALGLKPKFDS